MFRRNVFARFDFNRFAVNAAGAAGRAAGNASNFFTSSTSFGNAVNISPSGQQNGGFRGNPFSNGGTFGSGPFGGGGGGGPGGFIDQMLEWCSRSHAHDIAQRMGIGLKDVKFHYMPDGSVRVQVEAPGATEEEIKQLGDKVQEECPVARFRKTMVKKEHRMEWSALPPGSGKR